MERVVPESIRSALIKLAIDQTIKELIIHSSFFAVPVVNVITIRLVTWLLNFVMDKTELGLYFIYTENSVGIQASKLVEALTKYKEDKSAENEKELIERFNNFVKLKP